MKNLTLITTLADVRQAFADGSVHAARERHLITQQESADAIGVPIQSWISWEHGRRRPKQAGALAAAPLLRSWGVID